MGKVHDQTKRHGGPEVTALFCCVLLVAAILLGQAAPVLAKSKSKPGSQIASNIEVSASLADAIKAVQEVAADPIVYGTYVYERDKTLTGARPVEESSAFGNGQPQGKVFYKVVDDVIAPRHFKETEDSGTITVRYVVREISATSVAIRVDAVFVESAHRAVHASEGAVESAEFGQVQQHLNRIQARAKEALEDAQEEARATQAPANAEPIHQEPRPTRADDNSQALALPPVLSPSNRERESAVPVTPDSVAELEQRVNQLRRQVEARVKAPGAPLKSAPFHTATTIQMVPADSEVAILILTTYWYGVQTTDGHTGWIQRSQLEAVP